MDKDLTLVFRNVDADRTVELLSKNPDWNASARYDALAALGELEDFVRQLSYGNVDDPQTAANELMEKMKWA
nr:hypothetical protein [uncultured Pseudomonas sp.]